MLLLYTVVIGHNITVGREFDDTQDADELVEDCESVQANCSGKEKLLCSAQSLSAAVQSKI